MQESKIFFLDKNCNGFTIIEVLVAFIILFSSIVLVNMAYKQYSDYRIKQEKIENLYITVWSLINKIENLSLKDLYKGSYEGKLNKISYKISIKKIESKRNFVKSQIPGKKSGNYGNFILNLYKITLIIGNKKFVLYKTIYLKIND